MIAFKHTNTSPIKNSLAIGINNNLNSTVIQDFNKFQQIGNLPNQEKQKTYENLYEVLRNYDFDISFSLCSKYKELDEFAFTKFFIIPQLKKYSQELDINCDSKLLTHYLQMIDAIILYDNFNENKTPTKEMIIYRTQNFYGFLDSFCGLYNFNEFANFTENEIVKKPLLKILDKQENILANSLIELEINEEVKKVLLKNDIVKIIKTFRNSIIQKIIFFENKLKFQQ